ncbi:MAG: hypothetical protein ACR2J8_13480 [Thermomicrobiales bacterium]
MTHAETIAQRFTHAIAARWTDSPASPAHWMESFWTGADAPEPFDPPQAISLLGDLPAIRWYRRDGSIVGYAQGRPDGCFVVPDAGVTRHDD